MIHMPAVHIIPADPPTSTANDLDRNPLFHLNKELVHKRMAGLEDGDRSIEEYKKNTLLANNMVINDPSILDTYKLPFSAHNIPMTLTMTPVDRILYYRANPWIFAYEVIGRDILQVTAPTGTVFREFIQEQMEFLRDAMDPRARMMKLRCNRGGSKTFLLGLLVVIAEYIIPKCRITIQSGSEDQALTVYNDYFVKFMEDTELVQLVVNGKDGIHKKNTTFVDGGWVRIRTASLKSVKGPRPDILIIDEMYSTTTEFVVAAMGGNLTAHNMKFIFSGTPDTTNNIGYEIDPNMEHLEVTEAGWKIYHWAAAQCPWISAENIANQRSIMSHEEATIFLDGNHASILGTVYDGELVDAARVEQYPTYVTEWMDQVEAGKEYEPHGDVVVGRVAVGVDWGSSHPAAYVVTARFSDGAVYVIKSFKRSKMRLEEFIGMVVQDVIIYSASNVNADSEDPQKWVMLRDVLAQKGYPVGVTPMKFSVIKMPMITNTRWYFETGHIQLRKKEDAPLFKELKGYEFAISHVETGGVSEKPKKVNDDLCDALGMSMWAHRVKKDSVEGGMIVSSMNGSQELEYRGNRRFRRRVNLYTR